MVMETLACAHVSLHLYFVSNTCNVSCNIISRFRTIPRKAPNRPGQAELYNHSLACGRCWLLSDWYCIGCQNNKKYPPI